MSPSRPPEVPKTATFDGETKLFCERTPERTRMWNRNGTLMLDAPFQDGKLHGEVFWRLMIETQDEFAPRVALQAALGLPDGPTGTQFSTFDRGELTLARFVILVEGKPDVLRVPIREGKVDGDLEWEVGSVDEPFFTWRDIELHAKKTFKIPKPWPERAVATFVRGKVVKTEFFDEKGNPLGGAPGPIAEWGEATSKADLDGYVARGTFAADVARFFPKAKGCAPDELPKKSTKLAKLPARHRASADAFDALVRKKKLPYMGTAFDLHGYALDCVKSALDGAAEEKYFGIAYDGSGDIFLLDVTTGEVVVYLHDEGIIDAAKYRSLDEFAFAMLRVELAASDRVPKARLKKLLTSLEIEPAVLQLGR
jgi:hypothetical protein